MNIENIIELWRQGKQVETVLACRELITSSSAGAEEVLRAREILGHSFMGLGMWRPALDEYEEFQKTALSPVVANSIAEIYLEIHKYSSARNALIALDPNDAAYTSAIESVVEKTKGYINDVPGIVEGWLVEESKLEEQLQENFDFEKQFELITVRKYLAHYASVLESDLGVLARQTSITVFNGGMGFPRTVSVALGTAYYRWFLSAHANVFALALLSQAGQEESEVFGDLTRNAFQSIQKKYLHGEAALTEGEAEEVLLNNLLYSMNVSNHPAAAVISQNGWA
jgi:hypothetical protein